MDLLNSNDTSNDLPPIEFLKLLALHWPHSVWLYIYLWEKRNEAGHVILSEEEIDHNFELSDFKKNLRNISLEGLISYHTKSDGDILIEMVQWEDIDE